MHLILCQKGIIASKINVTSEGIYLPISMVHLILALANLLAHNNIGQICYCGQISLQSAAVNCSFCDNLTPPGGKIYFAGEGTINEHYHVWKCEGIYRI